MSQDDFPQRGRCTLCLIVEKASGECSIMAWKVFLCFHSGFSWEVRWASQREVGGYPRAHQILEDMPLPTG